MDFFNFFFSWILLGGGFIGNLRCGRMLHGLLGRIDDGRELLLGRQHGE